MSQLDENIEKFSIPTHILVDVSFEIERAIKKHGEGKPATVDAFIRILVEEVGEAAKCVNKDEGYSNLYDEIIQIISVCVMWEREILKYSTA